MLPLTYCPQFAKLQDGNCHVTYKVTVPGIYVVSVKFNDEHIPDSPFQVTDPFLFFFLISLPPTSRITIDSAFGTDLPSKFQHSFSQGMVLFDQDKVFSLLF